MDEHDVERIADDAARKAIHNLLELLGVDSDRVEDINKLRAALMWARRSQQFSDAAKGKALLVFVGLLVAGAFAMFWDGLKAALGMNGK